MALDKEQQARLTFLTEAETYFSQIESVLLSLNTAADWANQIDVAMRAAHSVKGTAGMMGFGELSRAAHSLEASFKILRARQLSVDTQLETLLLRGVDGLRAIRHHHHRQQPIDPQWLVTEIEPIFAQLRQQLGELTPEDEARLLSEDNNASLDFVIFTTSVEDCLSEFEQTLSEFERALNPTDLRQALITTTQQMVEFGRMAQLEPFISLCQTIQEQGLFAPAENVYDLAQRAMQAWQRSHALVVLGRTERLPTQLPPPPAAQQITEPQIAELHPTESHPALTELPLPDLATASPVPDIRPDISSIEINHLQKQLAALDLDTEVAANRPGERTPPTPEGQIAPGHWPKNLPEPPFTPSADRVDPSVDLQALQQQFAALQAEAVPELQSDSSSRSDATAYDAITYSVPATRSAITPAVPLPEMPLPEIPSPAMPLTPPLTPLTVPPQLEPREAQQPMMVRVPVDQLRQINRTFESLIFNRNSVNLKLEQLQVFSTLMQERMTALTAFNRGLQQWYDQASIEGVVASGETIAPDAGSTIPPQEIRHNQVLIAAPQNLPKDLDVLEFDRYSRLHLLAQEHMETIVKLEEVSRDLELGLSELGQAVHGLNYNSQALKHRITQTQMRPFEEIVGRFPRVVRDWSVQYGKSVQLTLEGTGTLIEQVALEQISDPLMHLLRNAFDHGIESPEIRQAQQKPAVGTISLRAVNRGNRVVITLSDDGGGIDLDRVRDRIGQYNLPEAQVNSMTREELLSFIFEPGFSTRQAVTELSGRGVGMDVVRTNLKALQGDIQVATEIGKGTTFTLSMPLSLSIVRVMMLEQGGFVFALPVDGVQAVIRTSDVATQDSSLTWKDGEIPLVGLESCWTQQQTAHPFEMRGQPLINCPMVIVVGEGHLNYGLAVDRYWYEQDVAVRSVASPMPMPPGFSGVTVLGDGRVVPLVEPTQLWEWLETKPELSPPPPEVASISAPTEATRILVVDDSIHARRYLAATLERSGYLVEEAKDGREAVDKLARGLQAEVVICDIEMPRLDGYGVLEELRELPQFRDLPILMLTSRSSDKHRKLAMNLGATDYFVKPYNEQVLLRELKQFTDN